MGAKWEYGIIMRSYVFFLTVIFLAGCASTNPVNPEFERVKSLSLQQTEIASEHDYFGKLAAIWNKYDLWAVCQRAGEVEVILTISEKGNVEDAIANPDFRTECYREAFTKIEGLPKPPESPFHFSLVLQ